MGQRQTQIEVRSGAELNGGLIHRVVQHVPAGGTRSVDEVHVASGNGNSFFKDRRAETADDTLDVVKAQLLIAAHRLGHRRVGLALLDHRAGNHVAEPPRDAHRVHEVSGRFYLIDECRKLLAPQALGRGHLNTGDEVRRHRKGRALV